jgi:uncharacterized membrane protein
MSKDINNDHKKQQKNILTVYIGLIICAIFQFVPFFGAQLFSALFFIILFISAYTYRARANEDSLQKTHTGYIIKTIWIFSLFLFLGMILASILADSTSIHDTLDKAKNGVMMSEVELNAIMAGYMKTNLWVFISCLGPSFMYFIYRLTKGIRLVRNYQHITDTKNWF